MVLLQRISWSDRVGGSVLEQESQHLLAHSVYDMHVKSGPCLGVSLFVRQ